MRGTAEARSPATAILQALVHVTRLTFLLGLGLHQQTNQLPVGASQPHLASFVSRTEAAGCLCRRVIGPARGEEKETDGPC